MKPRKRNAPRLPRTILRLRPNDIVVFYVERMLNPDQRAHMHAGLKGIFPHNRCIVLDDGITVGILRKLPGG